MLRQIDKSVEKRRKDSEIGRACREQFDAAELRLLAGDTRFVRVGVSNLLEEKDFGVLQSRWIE